MTSKNLIILLTSLLLLQGCTVQPKKGAPAVETGSAPVVQPEPEVELDKVDEHGRMNVDPLGPQPVPKTGRLNNLSGLTLS